MNDKPPSPIDYFSPLARPEPTTALPETPRPAIVVPMEFDTVLTHSADHGAVAAIETALRAKHIPTHRADDGQLVGREITLYVRGVDQAVAAPVAAAIFARRQRVKAMEPPKVTAVDKAFEGIEAGRAPGRLPRLDLLP